jgi:hypothetical protein
MKNAVTQKQHNNRQRMIFLCVAQPHPAFLFAWRGAPRGTQKIASTHVAVRKNSSSILAID